MSESMDIRQGYVLIVDMVSFSEQVPYKQAEWVERFIAVLAESVEIKLNGLEFNVFPTGDGAIIDVAQHKMATLHANVIQIGNGINLAERILNFAEPREIVVTSAFWETLANAADSRCELFCIQKDVFVKHMRNVTIHIYNPQSEESAWIAEPREFRNRSHKRYAYFPPMKERTLDRFREVGLEADILQTVEYVYETIAAVNTGYKFISWAPLADVLAAARPEADEEVLVFSRSDYEGHFWTTPGAASYLRKLPSRGFNQKRLFIYSDARPDIDLAPTDIVKRLVHLHAAGSLRKLESGRARLRRLHRFRFGVTLYPERGCLIAPVPAPASYNEYLDIVKFVEEPWRIFDRFEERSFANSEFKAFVVADKSLIAELIQEFVDLFDDLDSEAVDYE
jgi:hypothetical protein